MLYSCTHMATVGVKGLMVVQTRWRTTSDDWAAWLTYSSTSDRHRTRVVIAWSSGSGHRSPRMMQPASAAVYWSRLSVQRATTSSSSLWSEPANNYKRHPYTSHITAGLLLNSARQMNGDPIGLPVEFIAWLRPVNLVRFCTASAKQLPCRYCGGLEKLGSGVCPSLDWRVSTTVIIVWP